MTVTVPQRPITLNIANNNDINIDNNVIVANTNAVGVDIDVANNVDVFGANNNGG